MEYEKIIHLEEAGTLKNYISRSEQNNIFSLKITGFINKKDVDDVLDYMCSSEGDYDDDGEGDNWIADEKLSPCLRYLDLSGCIFVGGNKFPDMGWHSLLEFFAFPQGIEYVCDDEGGYCLGDALQLKTVVLPEGVKDVGSYCSENLTEINIPESVETINDRAFSYCRKLSRIRIPRNVRYIGEGAFAQCGITTFEIDPENPYFTTIDGVIFTKNLKTLVAFPPIYRHHYDIPVGTEIIGAGAFEDCNLDTIHIPDTVTKLESCAFQCSGLYDIYIPDSVTEISEICFRGSSNLQSIRLPQNIHRLVAQAISGCKNIKEIDIPASVKQIDTTNIVWNESLERIYLHNGLEEIIGDGPFLCRPGHLKEVYLPKTLRYFPGGMFHYCPDLKSFDLDPENPYFTEIEDAIYTCDGTKLIAVPDCTRKSFVIPEGVKAIGDFVFMDFKQLERVQLPDSLEFIGHRAFNWSRALKEIVLPANLKKLDFRTFDDCNLKRIVCLSERPPMLMDANPHWKFLHDSKDIVIEVPNKSLSLYQKAEGWNQVRLSPIMD